MFVLGTAGHVDHGKSTLIRVLTGIDPDRLREEKERGMTIDLGFAWLRLPSGREIGIVDVPGHERFIKNMLAGVGGVDVALLVVAADEGVMPQTREHLAILDLLNIKYGIVVITKKDLVDEELLSVVKLEVESLLEPTSLRGAPIIAVSTVTGEGLDRLIKTIDYVLLNAQPRKDVGRPRLLIDRVFSIAGSGTVVTGTLIDGRLSVGDEVEIQPVGLKTRVRALQTHKTRVDTASVGTRVAVNLAGIAASQIQRGYVLTKPGWLVPTMRVDVKLRLLAEVKHPLRHGVVVNFFAGSSEVAARVHLLDREKMEPGDVSWAQFTLAKPLALVKGDGFIIRSPDDTLGGGQIVDPCAVRHRRFRTSIIENLKARSQGTTEEAILATIEVSQPLSLEHLAVKCNMALDETRQIVNKLTSEGNIVSVGRDEERLLFTSEGWQGFVNKAKAIVGEYHRQFPARPGIPKGELSSKLRLMSHSLVLEKLFSDGVLADGGTFVSLPSYEIKLSNEQQGRIKAFLNALAQYPYAPPSDVKIEDDLLNLLIAQRQVVKVAEGIVFLAAAYDEMIEKLVAYIRAKGEVTVSEVRDVLGTSRKYAVALLEHMDERKITRRIGDVRVLR